MVDQAPGRLADQHLAVGARLLEPGRRVHRVADQNPALADHQLAGVHRRAHPQAHAPASLELVIELRERPHHGGSGTDGAQRVVLAQLVHAKRRHDAVAAELLDGSPV